METYIIVTYDGKGYSYYFTSNDTANFGVDLTGVSELDVDMVKPNHKVDMPLDGDVVTIDDKSYYAVIISPDSCSSLDSGVETLDKSELEYTVDNGEIIIKKYRGDKKNIKIPDTIDGMVVKEIKSSAFETLELTKVVLPNHVGKIGDYAFTYSQLKSLIIPSTVEYIGKHSFEHSTLTKLIIPGSVKTIEKGAFNDSPLTKLVLNEGLEDVGDAAFGAAKLTELTLPNTLVTIGEYAFEYCKLTSLVIPASVTSIGTAVFWQSELTSLVIKGKETSNCLVVESGKFTSLGSSPFKYALGYSKKDIVCEK